jgi:hypothetical protein
MDDVNDRLRALAVRYAAGVDRRDVDLFLDAFHADGTLTILPQPGSPGSASVLRGHAELARVIDRIQRYDRTFHLLGQTVLDAGADRARGEVYCVAHHWRTTDGGVTDTVLYIRYDDEYRPDATGEWRIATRVLHLDGREVRDVTGDS